MCIETKNDGVILQVQVQTRSSITSVAGTIGDYLKIRLKSPPVENQANRELIAFLGKTFKIPKGNIEIFRGKIGRKKKVFLRGISAEEVEEKLLS